MRRPELLLCLLVLLLAACSSEVPITVSDGSTWQSLSELRSYDDEIDLVLVVDDAETPEAERLRTRVLEALQSDAMRLLQRAEPSARGSIAWTHVDVRAFVARPGGADILTPAEDPRLAWREDDGTVEGARRFLGAVEEILAQPAREPRRSPLASLRAGLARARREPLRRLDAAVLATTRDDPDAQPVAEPELFGARTFLDLRTFLPEVEACKADPSTRLAAWLRANRLAPESTCTSLSGVFGDWEGFMRCASNPIARDAVGAPRCKVRAFLDDAGPCDAARGLTLAKESPSRATPEGSTICDVAHVDDATCLDLGLARRASGWCVPLSRGGFGRCEPRTPVTFVGGGLGPSARYEIVCEHTR
jgi:hypothetical protein